MGNPSVARWLWWMFLGSVFIYPAVVYVIPVQPPAMPVGALVTALYAVAAILVVSGVLIRSRFAAPDTVRKYATMPLARMGVSPESEEGRRLASRFGAEWLLRVDIISWALAEAISILGLVAALISARPTTMLPFSVASLVLMLRMRPNFSAVDTLFPSGP
jgi:hypothetical protein